jgi:hypothetical protein
MDGQGRWSCASHEIDLATEDQRKGCNRHRYIPILLAKTATPIDRTHDSSIVYQMPDGKKFVNGDPEFRPDFITSAEIHACKDKIMLVDQQALELRTKHNGRFV